MFIGELDCAAWHLVHSERERSHIKNNFKRHIVHSVASGESVAFRTYEVPHVQQYAKPYQILEYAQPGTSNLVDAAKAQMLAS